MPRKNIDRSGLCKGTIHSKGKPPKRCFRPGEAKHITPIGVEYFLCDVCEADVMQLLDEGDEKAVNQYIAGGSRTTGIGLICGTKRKWKNSPKESKDGHLWREGLIRIRGSSK